MFESPVKQNLSSPILATMFLLQLLCWARRQTLLTHSLTHSFTRTVAKGRHMTGG